MSDTVKLYSFGDADRSGKIRWTAAELGLEIEEHRVKPGTHRRAPYLDINPYGQIPAVEFRGQTMVESTTICYRLSDAIESPKLQVDRGEPGRAEFLYWMSVFTENHEARLVESAVSKAGFVGPEYFDLHESSLRRKLAVSAEQLPEEGWLCGERFTLADICAGYSLRLAVQCGLVTMDQVNPYLDRLRERPAAIKSRMFDSLR